MKQIITINSKGEVATLEFKKGVDVKQLGKAKIRRVTDIVWLEDEEMWAIRLLQGMLVGATVTHDLLSQHGLLSDELFASGAGLPQGKKKYCTFSTYEKAVRFEIMMIQTARKLGVEHLFIDDDLI